jgi:hypothetical protein
MNEPRSAALPFTIRREHGVVGRREVTSTEETLYGLLRIHGDQLAVQWRTSRQISRVGREIRTDREMDPVEEIALPVSGLARVEIRRKWLRWWFRPVLILTAADLRTFDQLGSAEDGPSFVLEHPAELQLELRSDDVERATFFASKLALAISEEMLRELDAHDAEITEHSSEIGLGNVDFENDRHEHTREHARRQTR